MITIIGLLAGLLPHLFGLFKDYLAYKQAKIDAAQELAIMQLQIDFAKTEVDANLREAEIAGTVQDSQIVHTAFQSDSKFVDIINNLIRPLIVTCFLMSYCYVQFCIIEKYMAGSIPLGIFADLIWTENEQAMLNAILMYYFGNFVRSK
jgi:hypothetical protein